ncbi:hypothetical protein N7449_000131 [Penicillium cf. viridicatum]|uniref:Uncharacterized protein n=2 Tax=Penicillium TaxID=5073 RepID=A0A9W9N4F1_9EURO|nr:hypothetical protein N7449_000131 [Penicillium cf. viridicatum]
MAVTTYVASSTIKEGVNTPNVFRGTRQVTIVPKRLATCQRTHTRKPRLIWVWICMGHNNVDVSCIGTRVATEPSPYDVSWGLRRDGGREVERVGERREEEEEERWEGSFYMVTSQVPSQNRHSPTHLP